MKRMAYLIALVASAALWSIAGYSEDTQVRRRAEAKLQDYFTVKFETGLGLPLSAGKSTENYTLSLTQIARAVKANKAVMMYFYVIANENERDEGLKTRAAKCADIIQDVFSGDEKAQELGILVRACEKYKVDVSKVKTKDNPYYNSETAPVVVVIAGNGNVVSTLSGNSITCDNVAKALGDALTKSGIDAKAISSTLKKNSRTFLNLEIKRATLDREIDDAEKNISLWRKDKNKVQEAVKLEKSTKVKEGELSKVKQELADVRKSLEAVPEIKALEKK